jgi:hypothetical protein
MMHPLDEKYWSKPEYWRWWGYNCPEDPRLVVSKRPRWAGFTVNFGHRHAVPFLFAMSFLVVLPIIACILLAPENDALIATTCGVVLALALAWCYKAANPRTWKGEGSPHEQGDGTFP